MEWQVSKGFQTNSPCWGNPQPVVSHWSYSVVKIEGDSFTIVRLTSMPTSASPKTHQGFDYTSLDPTTSRFVQQQTGEIRALMKRTAQDIIQVGKKLIQVKGRLGHGRFLTWLETEFDWHRDTANKFMHVANQFGSVEMSKLSTFDISALYQLAAPSTPQAAREEAIARAKTGEAISNKAAKSIKQKYATPTAKPKHEPEPEPKLELPLVLQSPPTPIPEALPQARLKQQILAIIPPKQTSSGSQATNALLPQAGVLLQNQPTPPVSAPDVPSEWWQLGGKHLLYCGDPNSSEFLRRVPEQVALLFAFPPTNAWQTTIPSDATIKLADYLPMLQNPDKLDEALESAILLYSRFKDTVVSCFLPSLEIVSIFNRLGRQSVLAEPDSRRCNAVISDWKKAGMKVERVN
jgi:hypothetical protein